jgi:hypothetical protein
MPDDLVDAFASGDVVVFAGAGVSTESPLVGGDTVYGEVVGRLGLDQATSFSAAMGAYSDRHGRPALLQLIRRRLDYVRAFPELHRTATAFSRMLVPLFSVENIVTTNWDTNFEDVCGATPIVVPDDYAFWDMPGRKVLRSTDRSRTGDRSWRPKWTTDAATDGCETG